MGKDKLKHQKIRKKSKGTPDDLSDDFRTNSGNVSKAGKPTSFDMDMDSSDRQKHQTHSNENNQHSSEEDNQNSSDEDNQNSSEEDNQNSSDEDNQNSPEEDNPNSSDEDNQNSSEGENQITSEEDNHKTSDEDSEEAAKEDSAESDLQSEVDEESATEREFVKLRQELAELPFEDVQKLKEKIGLKQFNEIYYGTTEKPKTKKSSCEKKTFKRENKNRPMEMSSKRPVPRLKPSVPVKKAVVRDPRFDDLSGEYNETIFQQTYGFLTGVKQREKEKLLKQLEKEKDPDKKQQISSLVTRLTQKEKIEIEKQAQKEREKKLRIEEKEMVKEGKKPFYWKKSEKRKLELAEKFRELKKSGKVETYLGKKRKRTAAKERKKLPNKG